MTLRAQWFMLALAGLIALILPQTAQAIPAFARQTSMPCASCHVGSFGPQLTKMGRLFKASGYTMGEKQPLYRYLAAMAVGGNEHTREPVVAPETGKPNNNTTVDEVSLFYGGRITSNVGLFAQVTYEPNEKVVALDNTDLRFAAHGTLAGKALIYGVTVNNNPTMQDLWQTTPAWGYPYVSSALAPSPDADGYISALGGQVVGVGAYGLWNDLLYVEYSRYGNIADNLQRRLGNGDVSGNDHLKGGASYWRVALQHDFGPHYFELGAFGLDADRYPGNDRDQGTDKFVDAAIDGTWQYTSGDGNHMLSAYVTLLHERQDLKASFALGDAANAKNHLDIARYNLSYNFKSTYGVTVGRFSTTGSADTLLYGSPNNKPDSSGYVTQLDFTPFGKVVPAGLPEVNIRLFIQYTVYDKFNGTAKNYDGTGRNASDNNTVFTGIWLAY